MKILPFVWFATKSEKKEFEDLLKKSKDFDSALVNVLTKYPDLKIGDVEFVLKNNFKKLINNV